VLYESPHRLMKTLDSIINVCGPNQKIFVALELTKMFESHFTGTVEKVFEDM
jgi:16S rRNA (cytidine1402-2'-O)-methyltransferase